MQELRPSVCSTRAHITAVIRACDVVSIGYGSYVISCEERYSAFGHPPF